MGSTSSSPSLDMKSRANCWYSPNTAIGSAGAAPVSGALPRRTEAGSKVSTPKGLSVSARVSRIQLRRSEEHTSDLQSLMRNSYAVFCLKKKKQQNPSNKQDTTQNTNT